MDFRLPQRHFSGDIPGLSVVSWDEVVYPPVVLVTHGSWEIPYKHREFSINIGIGFIIEITIVTSVLVDFMV